VLPPPKYLLVVELALGCSVVAGRAFARSLRFSSSRFFKIDQWPDIRHLWGTIRGESMCTMVNQCIYFGYTVPGLKEYLTSYTYLGCCDTLEDHPYWFIM